MINADKIQIGDKLRVLCPYLLDDAVHETVTVVAALDDSESIRNGYWVHQDQVEKDDLKFHVEKFTLVATNTKYSDISEGDTVEIACLSDEQINKWDCEYLIGKQGVVTKKSKSIHVNTGSEGVLSEWCLQSENLRVVEKAQLIIGNIEGVFNPSLETRKNGKIKADLLETGFPNAMMALAEVMTWAADYKGYLPNDWKDIPDAKNSLLAAAARHRLKRLKGEEFDDESKLPHLYHEAFNVMAQLELLITGKLE